MGSFSSMSLIQFIAPAILVASVMSFWVCRCLRISSWDVPLTLTQSSTSALWAMAVLPKPATPTTQTTATTLSFAKKVSQSMDHVIDIMKADIDASVRELAIDSRDQENHQGERDPEVSLHCELESSAPRSPTPHREDDTKWPQKNKDGRQELEIRLGNEHISFEVCIDSSRTREPPLTRLKT